MPIYEYRCKNCRRKSSVFTRSFTEQVTPSCPRCGSTDMVRLISTFAIQKSWGDSLDWAPGENAMSDVDESDPRSVVKYMRRMKKEMGDEATPEVDQMMDELESEAESLAKGEAEPEGGDVEKDDTSDTETEPLT